jgi:hypothetical protein
MANKKTNNDVENPTQKTKERAARTPLKAMGTQILRQPEPH